MNRIFRLLLGTLLILCGWLILLGCLAPMAFLDDGDDSFSIGSIVTVVILVLGMYAGGTALVVLPRLVFGPDTGSKVMLAGFCTATVAVITAWFSGPSMYHAFFGVKAEGLIAEVARTPPAPPTTGGGGMVFYRVVEAGSDRRIGRLTDTCGPSERARQGERIEVSVDPHHHVVPVAADCVGWTTPSALLLTCFAVISLSAAYGVRSRLRAAGDEGS